MRVKKEEMKELLDLLNSGEYDEEGLAEAVYETVYRQIQRRDTLHGVAVLSPTKNTRWAFGPYINKTEANKAARSFQHAGSEATVHPLRPALQEEA